MRLAREIPHVSVLPCIELPPLFPQIRCRGGFVLAAILFETVLVAVGNFDTFLGRQGYNCLTTDIVALNRRLDIFLLHNFSSLFFTLRLFESPPPRSRHPGGKRAGDSGSLDPPSYNYNYIHLSFHRHRTPHQLKRPILHGERTYCPAGIAHQAYLRIILPLTMLRPFCILFMRWPDMLYITPLPCLASVSDIPSMPVSVSPSKNRAAYLAAASGKVR